MKAECKREYAPVTISITFESEYELELFSRVINNSSYISHIICEGEPARNRLVTMMSQIHLAIKQQKP